MPPQLGTHCALYPTARAVPQVSPITPEGQSRVPLAQADTGASGTAGHRCAACNAPSAYSVVDRAT